MSHPQTRCFIPINTGTYSNKNPQNRVPSWILLCICYQTLLLAYLEILFTQIRWHVLPHPHTLHVSIVPHIIINKCKLEKNQTPIHFDWGHLQSDKVPLLKSMHLTILHYLMYNRHVMVLGEAVILPFLTISHRFSPAWTVGGFLSCTFSLVRIGPCLHTKPLV